MPRGDRTGPSGEGSMTGRGAGLCGGYSSPGYAGSRVGYYGFGGGGRGAGRWWRNNSFSTGMNYRGRGFRNNRAGFGRGFAYPQAEFSSDLELMMLKEQAEFMQKEVCTINERIRELESTAPGQKE